MKAGQRFRGTIDDPVPESFEQGTKPVVTYGRVVKDHSIARSRWCLAADWLK